MLVQVVHFSVSNATRVMYVDASEAIQREIASYRDIACCRDIASCCDIASRLLELP